VEVAGYLQPALIVFVKGTADMVSSTVILRRVWLAALFFAGCISTPSRAMAADPPSSDAARAAYTAAAALQNREAWELAAEEWAALIANHPTDPLSLKGRYYLGVCQAKTGDWQAAAKTFRDVLGSTADLETQAAARWELARGSFQAAQREPSPQAYQAAASALQDYLSRDKEGSQRDEATFYLGESLWQEGKRDPALDVWSDFVRQYPSSRRLPEVLYALGVGQAEVKRHAEALATLRQFGKSFPQHPLADDVAIWRADVAIALNDMDEVERVLKPLAAADGRRSTEALERLGATRWKQKRWPEAAEAYLALASRQQGTPDALGAVASAGRAYIEAGMPDKARPLLQQALAADGNSGADAAQSLILLELDAKSPQRALEIATKKIAELSAQSVPDAGRLAKLELARADALWEIRERRDEAAAAYAEVAKKYPANESVALAALAMTALALLDQGKPGEALATAESFLGKPAAATSGQRLLDVKAIRAEALLAQGDYPAAAAAYRELIAGHSQAPQLGTWQIREAVALSAARQWQQVHDRLSVARPALRDDLAAEGLFLDATSLVELEKSSTALPLLAEIDRQHASWSRRDEALLLGIRARQESGDPQGALSIAEALIKAFPQSRFIDVAWYRLGQLRQDAKQYDSAIKAYDSSISAKPSGARAPWALLAIGWCHEASGRLTEAISAWTLLIDSHPESRAMEAALLARGDARYRSGDFDGGLADATQYLKSRGQPENDPTAAAEARMLGGLCLVGTKRYADAVKAFRRILDEQPSFAAADRVTFEMGVAQLLDGQRAEAEETFRMVVSRYPTSSRAADAWFEIGEARFEAAAWDDAATAYKNAIKAVQDTAGADQLLEQTRHKLGWACAMKSEHAAAVTAFKEQITYHPSGVLTADAQAMLGESLFQMGDHRAALEQLTAALADPKKLSSDDLRGLALIRAGECAAQQQDWPKSLALAEQLERSQPTSPYTPQARYAAAWARQNMGQLDEALAAFRRLADGGRTEIAARARLMEGEVLFEQGNHKDAVKAFFKVAYGFGEQQAPPAFHAWQAQATYEAARCFEALGEREQATRLYAELVERYPDSAQTPAARKRLDALGPPPPASGKRPS
jgi:TolA-binding protein